MPVSPDWVPLAGTSGAPRHPALGVVPRQLPRPLQHLEVALTSPGVHPLLAFGCSHSPLSQAVQRMRGGCGKGSLGNHHQWEQHRQSSLRGPVLVWDPQQGILRCGVQKYPEGHAQSGQDHFHAPVQMCSGVTLGKSPDFLEPQCHHL